MLRKGFLKLGDRDLPLLLHSRARADEPDLPLVGIVRPEERRTPAMLLERRVEDAHVVPASRTHGDHQPLVQLGEPSFRVHVDLLHRHKAFHLTKKEF